MLQTCALALSRSEKFLLVLVCDNLICRIVYGKFKK